MHEHDIVAEGLAFPEGPVVMADGSVIVVEIRAGRITRVRSDGRHEVIATPGGGPNGAAIGPDGALYVCNNGGFEWYEAQGMWLPGGAAADYTTGRIERIDLATGRVERLFDSVDGRPLSGPNDIVFDAAGGFWFTDLGKHRERHTDHGGLFYAHPGGGKVSCAAYGPNLNGVGLSPDGGTVYAAHTMQRLLLAFEITGPGEVAPDPLRAGPGRVAASFPGRVLLDSMAVEANGRVCVATLVQRPGVSSVDPATGEMEDFAFPDLLTTNIAFGGSDMMDAWICQSTTGKLVRARWPRPGLKLAFNA